MYGNTVVTTVTLAIGEKGENSLLFAQRGHSAQCSLALCISAVQ